MADSDLKQQVEDLTARNKELHSKIQALTNDTDISDKSTNELKSQVIQFQDELKNAQDRATQYEDKYNKMSTEYMELSNQYRELQTQLDSLKNK
ncbi:hypothetical protein [Fructilactobacillus fructivorans]|uniref:Uncharacterized protein n=1 Tax=Fructilactobacillus fructivorans TaxID=1614 RepID=A0A0C1M6R1_9LACO|nr:hypothetical protein [Fructilactobacillus fructivorans]KID41954.1 hypothetical protein LfDm3_0622 [Fructilactobacillus fructivorans]MCT0151613.1 hypothetical protein [Fructilactobacillus fructivorans]MCT2867258.1 hypothetical protein [Fructilactobacillus fructivorans]MCT2868181.1 hypothetical protein [Fructilactobacillus fructivorans]MCT2872889.1 hypothetical protein [Fructilactobacillus fructivorans]